MTVAKLQRPLAPSSSESMWLLYTEDRDLMILIPEEKIPSELRDSMGSDLKAYFEVEMVDGHLSIVSRVQDQPW